MNRDGKKFTNKYKKVKNYFRLKNKALFHRLQAIFSKRKL